MLSAAYLVFELILIAGAVMLAIPAAVLLAQVAVPHRSPIRRSSGSARPRVQVIIPAHNEAQGIGDTIRSIQSQLTDGDGLLVVADNCRDTTARIAREHGSIVVERRDDQNIGKGFAINHGKQHLDRSDEFDVVILVDADCRLGDLAIESLSRLCRQRNRPVQAAYMMELPPGHQYKFGAMKLLAWRIKNYVRPLGGGRLGFPCQLTGSGMAFPTSLFFKVNFATADIAEDLKFGIDLAIGGYAPVFCPQAQVLSQFPLHGQAMHAQRKRWEHGYLMLMKRYVPILIGQAFQQKRFSLLAMAADLAVPPLALLLLLSLISLIAALAIIPIAGQGMPLKVNLIQSSLLLAAVAVIWFRHGRDVVSWRDLRQLPVYVFSKLPLYASFFTSRQTRWIRTDRDDIQT